MENNQKEIILLKDLGLRQTSENSKQKRTYGLFKCFCGNEFTTQLRCIKNGTTKSCGCLKGKNRITHGLTKHRLYFVWYMMIDRCTNEKHIKYKYYGGRGITVSERWLKIENFIEDMYPTFTEGLELDRENVNGNYCRDNCRWTTKNIQNRNTTLIRKNNTSGYRGVTYVKKLKKYIAGIVINKIRFHLGYFKDGAEAAKAYDNYIIDNNLEHTKNFS
jgi:hypothetical protein